MIADRAPVVGITEAITTTFDGEHPCRMCDALKEVRAQETNPVNPKSTTTESSSLTAKLLGIEFQGLKLPGASSKDLKEKFSWDMIPMIGCGAASPITPPPRLA